MVDELPDRSVDVRRRLLARLADRLAAERPDVIEFVSSISREQLRSTLLPRNEWIELLAGFVAPESGALTAVFDLDLGLDQLDFAVDSIQHSPDGRALWAATDIVVVHYFAALERVEDLVKRLHRQRFISKDLFGWATAQLRPLKDAPVVEYRHEVAHSAQHRPEGVRRVPESQRLWELIALTGEPVRPLVMTYGLPTTARILELSVRHRSGANDLIRVVEELYVRIAGELGSP